MSTVVGVVSKGMAVLAADTMSTSDGGLSTPYSRKLDRVSDDLVFGWCGGHGNGQAMGVAMRERGVLGANFADESRALATALSLSEWFRENKGMVTSSAEPGAATMHELPIQILVAHPAGVTLISAALDVMAIRDFYAIGSGSHFAMGALDVLAEGASLDTPIVARRAVSASMKHDPFTGGSIRIESVTRVQAATAPSIGNQEAAA